MSLELEKQDREFMIQDICEKIKKIFNNEY